MKKKLSTEDKGFNPKEYLRITPENAVTCVKCGHTVSKTWNFCTQCGHKMQGRSVVENPLKTIHSSIQKAIGGIGGEE